MFTLLFLFPDDNFTNSSIEILLLLTIAFILGYLLRFFIGQKYKIQAREFEAQYATLDQHNAQLVAEADALQTEKEELQTQIQRLQSAASKKPDSGEAVIAQPFLQAKDDLKQIEGIGVKIEQLLNADGIHTFVQLSEAKTDRLKRILKEAGERFRMHDPGTWSRQAKLAVKGQWIKLVRWQDKLKGGRE